MAALRFVTTHVDKEYARAGNDKSFNWLTNDCSISCRSQAAMSLCLQSKHEAQVLLVSDHKKVLCRVRLQADDMTAWPESCAWLLDWFESQAMSSSEDDVLVQGETRGDGTIGHSVHHRSRLLYAVLRVSRSMSILTTSAIMDR